jgi:hypothetical protein
MCKIVTNEVVTLAIKNGSLSVTSNIIYVYLMKQGFGFLIVSSIFCSHAKGEYFPTSTSTHFVGHLAEDERTATNAVPCTTSSPFDTQSGCNSTYFL